MDSKEIKNQDDLIERLVTDGKDIVEDLVKNEMSREKSWQHCYKVIKFLKISKIKQWMSEKKTFWH